MRLLRLFAAIFSVSLRRELAFRANLVVQLLLVAISIVSGLAAIGIVYTQTETLGGWRVGEAIALLGTYQIVGGLLATFIEPNVRWFAGQVKSGRLDDILLKPVSSIFLASLGSCAPLGLLEVLLGFGVLGLGIQQGEAAPTLWGILSWLLLLAVGLTVTWGSRVLLASIALWAPAIELDVVYGALWQCGRYPVTIYRQPIRFVLTYILPVAFVSTLPTYALSHGVEPQLLLASPLVAIGTVALVHVVWRAGLRRYTSATS